MSIRRVKTGPSSCTRPEFFLVLSSNGSIESLQGFALIEARPLVGHEQRSINKKDIRLHAAETLGQGIQERPFVEIVIVGMGRRQSPRYTLGHQRREGRADDQRRKQATKNSHTIFFPPGAVPIQPPHRERDDPSRDWESSWPRKNPLPF